MANHWNLDRLAAEWEARGLDRRELLRLVAGGATMTAILTLLGPRPLGAVAAPAAQAEDSQVSILWRQPVTLNPLFSTSGSEQQVERLMFGAIVKMSGDLVPTPDLAESIDVSDDATVYTFHLHQDITFTDGEPLTAEDVAFTLETALNPVTASIWRGRLLGIAGADAYPDDADSVSGIATPDDYTVEITLAAPDSAFLPIICNFSGLGILPKHILEEVAPDQLQAHPYSLAPDVTAGAYQFAEFEADQFLEITANPDYFGGAPAIERMFLRIVTPNVGISQLETGEMDLLALPVNEAERVRTLPDVTVISVPSPSMDFLALNLNREYLQNPGLRQAMMHAIDRQAIVDNVLQGEGEVVNSPIFGPEWMGVPEGLNEYASDPEQATQILADSGWDTSQTLQIMHIPDQGVKDAVISIIQEQLRTVGIQSEILQVDVAELNRRYITDNDFDIFYNAGGVFRADPSISGTYFLTRNFTPAGGNASHYSNEQVDELYAAGQATGNNEERKAAYTELAQILNADLPWIYLWSPNSLYAVSNRLQGYAAPSYIDNKFWNAETWSVSE
ncbi:MAG: ABC transporter substrate-binding protein [Chloroflexota bacterium]|nr:ABC transporter substrate-binding protein [Chloroflexota bacterium]